MKLEACLVCGCNLNHSEIDGLLRCPNCSFVTADVALSPNELEALYGERYFKGEEYRDYIGERPLIEKHFSIRLRKLLQYIPDASQKRLLEIGCAYGFFLSVAQSKFASVAGVDISREAVAYAREHLGSCVTAQDFSDYELRESPDVVCLWDTVEHVPRPHCYIEKLACCMKPGGVLAITTGDIGSFVARLRGRRWRQIHPPTHLHYFSKRTLTDLLRKFGFEVIYCGYDGMYRSLDTIAYIILNVKHSYPSVYRALKTTGLLNWDIYLNFRDIVFVIARKS